MNTQVIDIGDHDYCIAHTAAQTRWLKDNWGKFEKQGQLGWAFKELVKLVRNGHIAIKIFNAMNIADYVKVKWLLDRSADFGYCFVYAIDSVGKRKILGRWRGSKLRPVKDENHINIVGIMPNSYVWVEQRDKDQKYIKVYGYP